MEQASYQLFETGCLLALSLAWYAASKTHIVAARPLRSHFYPGVRHPDGLGLLNVFL